MTPEASFRYMYLVTLSLLVGLPAFARRYQSPNLKTKVFDIAKISLTTAERVELADELAAFARNGQVTDPAQVRMARRCLGLALRLDPLNKKATVADMQMSRGLEVRGVDTKFPGIGFAGYLVKAADKLKNGTEDAILRSYLITMASEIDARNEDAIYATAMLKRDGLAADLITLLDGAVSADGPVTRENAAYRNREKKFVRRQSAIKGLFVRQPSPGVMVGEASDIIITVQAQSREDTLVYGFVRNIIGESMGTSLEEAMRAVQVRYPMLEGGKELQASFADKYTPKDGGSAGTAFSLLILSLLDDFEIDQSFAVTGDVTVDWKTREVGGIAAKIRGAYLDKCRNVAIPLGNESQIGEMLLLEGKAEALYQIQVWGIRGIEDAVQLVRTDRDESLNSAMTQFKKVQAYLKRKPGAHKKSQNLQAALQRILAIAPNHLSAKWLLADARGQAPRTISDATAMEQTMFSGMRYLPLVIADWNGDPEALAITQDTRKEAGGKLARLQRISSPKVKPLGLAMMKFINSAHAFSAAYVDMRNPSPQQQQRPRPSGFRDSALDRKRIQSNFGSLRNRPPKQQASPQELYEKAYNEFTQARDKLMQTLESISDREMIESYLRR
jgi:hypothetical protein